MPAPVGGWNTRDPIAAMKPLYASKLTNFFPTEGAAELRGGTVLVASGLSGDVKSLYHYGVPSGTPKLLAGTNAGMWDISAGGAFGAPNHALTNGWVYATQMVNTAGTNYFWAANGVDKPFIFDGSSWTSLDAASTPAITGVTTTSLVFPWTFKRRLFVLQNNSMSVWYFDTDAIAGAANEFKLGPIFRRGGYLVAGTTWSIDAGDGLDDYWVVITSEGEVAVYKGTDISDSTKWSLVGVYYVGAPLGRRCFTRFRGDVLVLTEGGLFELSKALVTAGVDYSEALTSIIAPTFATAVGNWRTNKGWESTLFPPKNALLVNVPLIEGATAQQYVMNTNTQAWCDFNGFNGACFCFFDGLLYYGSSGGNVYRAWTGTAYHGGADVVGEAVTAYLYPSKSRGECSLHMVRPLLSYDGAFGLGLGIGADFQLPATTFNITTSLTVANPVVEKAYQRWHSPLASPAFAYALVLRVSSATANISWVGYDYLINQGVLGI